MVHTILKFFHSRRQSRHQIDSANDGFHCTRKKDDRFMTAAPLFTGPVRYSGLIQILLPVPQARDSLTIPPTAPVRLGCIGKLLVQNFRFTKLTTASPKNSSRSLCSLPLLRWSMQLSATQVPDS